MNTWRSGHLALGWLVAVGAALILVAVLSGIVHGGTLDPASAPAPTLRPLDDIAPVWSQALAHNDGADSCHSSRFLCVFTDDAAVLDRETGLVWQRTANPAAVPWLTAITTCATAATGGRLGWRVPTEEELRTVMQIALDPAAPFTVNAFGGYWTGRTVDGSTTDAFSILAQGAGNRTVSPKTASLRYWCVRGGQAYDGI